MNYIDCVKQQVIILTLTFLSSVITYAIIRHFEWGNAIILNQINIIGTTFGSLIFIFFGAYMNYQQLKK